MLPLTVILLLKHFWDIQQAYHLVSNLWLLFAKMVPIKEMTDVLRIVKETSDLKPKAWVRLKRGLYKDDLAQVSEI